MSNSTHARRGDARTAALTTVGATEARERFAELLGRVAFAKERILVTRNGQDVGVLVPMADYERLLHLDTASADGQPPSPPPTHG